MTNLKLQSNGDYEYDSRATGDTIRVTVSYWKDLRNRGIYVTIKPIFLCNGMMSCIAGSGASSLMVATARKNDRILAEVAARLDTLVPEAARLFEGQGPAAVIEDSTEALFAQRRRIKECGNAEAAIDLLRQVMVEDAAAVSQAAR